MILMTFSEYFIGAYWWLLMVIILVIINIYYINGYWCLFRCTRLVVILLLVIICYITSIDHYCIINYCWIFNVIISWAIGSYYIVRYLKLFFINYYFLF
jgi:hypothetical protein